MGDSAVKLSVGIRLSNLSLSSRKIFTIETPVDFTLTDPGNSAIEHKWLFPHIFSTGTTQQEVYVSMVGPLVEQALVAGNTCCLVYGQRGAGKTMTVFGDEGMIEQTLRRVLAEIKNDEKGVKAAIACIEICGQQATDLLKPTFTPAEINDHMGLFGIPDTTWVNIRSVIEPLNAIRKAIGARSAEHANVQRHNFVLFTISRYKTVMNPISSIIIGEINSLESLESDSLNLSLNHTSLQSGSLVVLGKVLSELCHEMRDESILTVKSLNGEWTLGLLACITPLVEKYNECLNVIKYANKAQSYPAVLKKLRKREFKEASADDKRILQLKGDIIDLKFDLQQREFVHTKVLKDLGLKFGLDFDLSLLKDVDPASRESKTVKHLREAMERSDTYKQMKGAYERRLHELIAHIEDAKSQSLQNTRKRNIELQAYEEELRVAKDKIEEIFPEVPESVKQEVNRLQTELEEDKGNLLRLSASITDLYATASGRSEGAENETMERRLGRDSLDAMYRKEYRDAEKLSNSEIAKMEKGYKEEVAAKDKQIADIEREIRQTGVNTSTLLSNFWKECAALSLTAKQQHELIESIKRGDFNKGVVPVMIPRGHQPEFPEKAVEKQ